MEKNKGTNSYYKILNEIATSFDMDQWNDQVNIFTDNIKSYLTDFYISLPYQYINGKRDFHFFENHKNDMQEWRKNINTIMNCTGSDSIIPWICTQWSADPEPIMDFSWNYEMHISSHLKFLGPLFLYYKNILNDLKHNYCDKFTTYFTFIHEAYTIYLGDLDGEHGFPKVNWPEWTSNNLKHTDRWTKELAIQTKQLEYIWDLLLKWLKDLDFIFIKKLDWGKEFKQTIESSMEAVLFELKTNNKLKIFIVKHRDRILISFLAIEFQYKLPNAMPPKWWPGMYPDN